MPYPTNLDAYPTEFAELYRRALSSRLEINCGNRKTAIALRHRLHAYRRAVELAKIAGWSDLRRVTLGIEDALLILQPDPISSLLSDSSEPTEDQLDQYLKDFDNEQES